MSIANKIAATNAAKAAGSEAPGVEAQQAAQNKDQPNLGAIQTGATGVGSKEDEVKWGQGRFDMNANRAPGYYSIHIGLITLPNKRLEWPFRSPLILEDHEGQPYYEQLKKNLDFWVKTGKAELVLPPEAKEE